MPNAAKLVAALGLAVLGFVLSGMVMALFEEDTNFGLFTPINVALGLVVGWIVVGRRAGRGWTSAINVGFTGAVLMVFWGLFVQSANKMFDLAMKNRFDNASEAILALLEIGAEFTLMMATVQIGLTIAIGGAIAGMFTEFAWRRWK